MDSGNSDEMLENAISDDDYEDSGRRPRRSAKNIFSDEESTNVADISSSFNYSPTAALPDFESDFSDDFPSIKGIDNDFKASDRPASNNLFDIKATPRSTGSKHKLTFIALHDFYDAKNVANLMIEKHTIIIVNLALLREDHAKRAMDFLDGVKYVTKSVFVRFSDSMCAFIPEDIELHGDFYNQVEL